MRQTRSVPKDLPRLLHPRVRVYCTNCKKVSRRYYDRVKEPCPHCGSTRVVQRKPGNHQS